MGLTPIKNGFIQTTYADVFGKAVNGMLAYASDVNLTDGVYVGDIEKAYAGRCYALKDGKLTTLTDGSTDEPVIVCFDQSMDSDVDGNFRGDVAKVLRTKRVGGRVWVEVTVASGSTVDDTAELKVASTGAFTTSTGVDVSSKVKVVGTYPVVDSKALCLVEVF